MSTSLERLEDCKAKITAEVPASVATDARKEIIASFASQAKIPGFRAGKIPNSVIEKRYVKQIEEELKERLVRHAIGEASKQEDTTVIGIVKVERELFEADGAFSLIAEVILEPDAEVKDYKEIPVEVPKMEITDEVVEDSLQSIRKNLAELNPVERAATTDDVVIFNYVAKIDDALKESLKENKMDFFLEYEACEVEILEGEETRREPLPGITAAITGKKAGDVSDVEIDFPEDFGAEGISGQKVTYEVSVTEVKERELPEVNDELAVKLGTEDLADLKDKIRQQNEGEREKMRAQVIQNEILKHLNDELEFDLPQHILFDETQYQVNQMVQQGYQQGLREEDIEENHELLVSNAQERAKSSVKTNVILSQIAKTEGISVSDEELSQKLMMDAMQQGIQPKKYFKDIQKKNQIDGIRSNLLLTKTLEFLVENAKITEVDSPEENEAKA